MNLTKFGDPEEFYIASMYASALINDDYSSFDYYYNEAEAEKEIKKFDKWVKETQAGRHGHWDIPDEAEDFQECSVSGLEGDCVKAVFHPILD